MRLKRLTLHGFKTFADKTEIEFAEGVTAIVGPNGSGKCVIGSTVVTLADGREIPIREIVDSALSKADTVSDCGDGTLTKENPDRLQVQTLNPCTLQLESRSIAAFVRRTAPAQLLRIQTHAGRTITATPYHPLFTLEEGTLRALRADEIREGLPIALPRSLQHETPATPFAMPPHYWLNFLREEDAVYVPPSPALQEWLDRQREEIGTFVAWRKEAGVSATQMSSLREGQAVKAAALMRLAEVVGNLPPLENSAQSTVAGVVQLPTVFSEDLARYLGLLVAEGRNTKSDQIWFVNSDRKVNDEFERLSQTLFGLKVARKHYKPCAEDCLVFSHALCVLMERVFQFPIGSCSAAKVVPPQVFASSSEVQWAFLSGLFEGDAHICVRPPGRNNGKAQTYIEYATASETLARQVISLLLRQGIFATLRKKEKYASNTVAKIRRFYYSVLIYGKDSLRCAAQNLRFIGSKQDALDALLALEIGKGNPNRDVIPGINPLVKTAVKTSGMRLKPERHRWPKLMAYVEGRCEASREGLRECIQHIAEHTRTESQEAVQPLLSNLNRLAGSDIYWDTVTTVETIAPEDEWVYDLCVAETHNFVANNIVVHNSNVLDSITWVLGEQKSSALRASRAQDVIFAGSARRKPLGMAEVSLTVDNEDRFLPLDFSEVTITRRIYRNGEGEYLINKVACRLKDITELFLDTGIGRGAYAIVNQSEIDAILSARSEDRRELFEEAAGIKKYRVKKREAQRKLEHTDQNLVRVYDIARELEGSLAPLEAQAMTAKRYQELAERLRAVEVGQLAADYKRYLDELNELKQTAEEAQKEAESLRAEATSLEESAKELGERISEAEAEMDTARLLQQNAMAERERVEGRIALAAERRASALRIAETVDLDLARLAEEKVRLVAEADERNREAQEATERAADRTKELAQAEAIAQEAERALAELSRTVAGQEADYLELARRLAGQKAELDAVRERIARRAGEIADTESRAVSRQAEAETAKTEAETLREQVTTVQANLAEARRILTEEREPERLKAIERVNSVTEQRTTTERRTAEQAARLRALEETEAAQEGYFAGVRSVTRGKQNGRLKGRFQVVADALRVPAKLDTAIEVALGSSLQDIITDTEVEAKAAIAFLNETRGGRATFLPLNALRSQEVPDGLRLAAHQHSGVLGSAADLVEHDPDVLPAVQVLLARILIVEDLDTATSVSRRISRDWAKIVTLNGEVVVPTGAITGGTQGKQGPNLLSRKREIAELTEAVRRGFIEIDRLKQNETDAKAESEAARQALRAAEAAISQARDAVGEAERRFAAHTAEAERLARDAEGLRQRAKSLLEGGANDTARESTLAAAITANDKQDVGAQATREELHQRQASLAVRRSEAQTAARTLSSELASLKERIRSLTREAERASEGALRATITAEERTLRAEEARALIATEDAEEASRNAERERAARNLTDATARFEKWRERRQALLNENFQLTERIKGANRGEQRATEQSQQARLKMARVETQMEAVGQRLQDEYDLHPDSAVALTGGVPVDRDTAQEISRIRREIKSLGAVNVGAIEEYERVSERWRFLTDQRRDLEEAKKRLLAAITEIDDATRGVFVETFEAVGKSFAGFFTRLFGGGTTELVMTNPDDVLETGIEILAQPPGKKRQSLTLLSGGERALTATALLFAFLDVRPAPFCVLDEVDAPLDGANVEKFADLLRDFGQQSQFIVITHNATTMEAAPLWYGVTMQEPGISRGLSMKVPEPSPSAESVVTRES